MDGVDKWEGFGIGVQEHKVSEKKGSFFPTMKIWWGFGERLA